MNATKTYRTYEAFRNLAGGIEPCGTDWEDIDAESAEEAARVRWSSSLEDADENTVIIATDDDGDEVHYFPQDDVCR